MSSIGITGLEASRSQLETASQNVTNAETTGFKSFRTMLKDVYSSVGTAGTAGMAGVSVQAQEQQFSQGQLVHTNNPFDLAIEGDGFFALRSPSGRRFYSRAGVFHLDVQRRLTTPDGMLLQGFAIDDRGMVDQSRLKDMVAVAGSIGGKASTTVSAVINLNADAELPQNPSFDHVAPDTYNWVAGLNSYDASGRRHVLNAYFVKNKEDEWTAHVGVDGATPGVKSQFTFQAPGKPVGPVNPLDVLLPDGTTVKLSLAQISQMPLDYSLRDVTADGRQAGNVIRIDLADHGYLRASYSNGDAVNLYQVALAAFPNQNALRVSGGNTWSDSEKTGAPLLASSGTSGCGHVRASVLEGSNVEISRALTDVMVAQRNFQLNARVYKAEDSLHQVLVNMAS